MITFDEGGGYWDSGYIQPVDFFGDGTRIPLIVVSPFRQAARSFILTMITSPSINSSKRTGSSTKRFPKSAATICPNPVASSSNPYAPTNSPAIGDLMDMFTFPSEKRQGTFNPRETRRRD